MAQRDLSSFRTVLNQVSENPDRSFEMVAEVGEEIIERSYKAKVTETISSAMLDLNALNEKYRIDYEHDPEGGVKKFKEDRQKIFQEYEKNINPLFKGIWKDKIREIEKSNDITNQAWVIKQSRINTVNSVNRSIKNNLQMAYSAGQNFALDDSAEIDAYVNYGSTLENLSTFARENLGQETGMALLEDYSSDYMKSFISGVSASNPKKAASILQQGFVKEILPANEIKDLEDIVRKETKQKSLQTLFIQVENEDKVTDLVNDSNVGYFEKILEIDKMEFSGNISSETAIQARRVLKAQKAVDSLTQSDDMADIITQIYDLNATQETNSQDYLVGVRNIREKILTLQHEGKLNPEDAKKLNGQLRTLTAAKTAEATQSVGIEFYDANKKFDFLPPEYRGTATRELFYRTYGRENLGKNDYDEYASEIMERIRKNIRTETLSRLEKIQTSDEEFVKNLGYSMNDVMETAEKYGISEREVIQRLKAQ